MSKKHSHVHHPHCVKFILIEFRFIYDRKRKKIEICAENETRNA